MIWFIVNPIMWLFELIAFQVVFSLILRPLYLLGRAVWQMLFSEAPTSPSYRELARREERDRAISLNRHIEATAHEAVARMRAHSEAIDRNRRAL